MTTVSTRRQFIRLATGVRASMLIGLPNGARFADNQNPLPHATAMWNMKDPQTMGVQIKGDVSVGVPLHGAEYEASIARGGDGAVAEFRGGYLILDQGAALDFSGKKEMTLCLRVRDHEGRWAAPLLSFAGRHDDSSGILYPTAVNRQYLNYQSLQRLQRGMAIEFLWRTKPMEQQVDPEYFNYDLSKGFVANKDWVAGVLRLQAPIELIGPDRWHDVIIRFHGPNLQLFVDGVLIDEEWPYGALNNFRGPFLLGAGNLDGTFQSGFQGQVDHIAFWDHALSDGEIASLSGGGPEINRRTLEVFGPEKSFLQYWRPRGFNTYVGDCMPRYYDGEFHLHYLFDRRHHHSKWGMGAHQFAHASSKDLIHWTHHPITVGITEQWECSIGTGDVVPDGQGYRAFYIQHQRRCWFKDAPYKGDTIHDATSSDGLHFRKKMSPVVPWTYLRRKDGNPGDINPDIFYPKPAEKNCYMSVSGEKMFVSSNLETWSEAQGFDLYKDLGKGICGSYFHWNGWYYFMTTGEYRMSRQPMQPGWAWTQPEAQATHDGCVVPKVAPFGEGRYLMVGFLGGPSYAGEVVFRELVQHENGILGTKWPAEMIPRTGTAVELPFETLKNATYAEGAIRVTSPTGFGAGMLAGVPQDVRITATIAPGPGASGFGLCVRGEGAYERGCELRFEPGKQKVQYGVPVSGGIAPGTKTPENFLNVSEILKVTGIDQPFTLDMIVKDDFVDTCIDSRRTLISRRSDRPRGNRLFFFAERGEVLFKDVTVRALT